MTCLLSVFATKSPIAHRDCCHPLVPTRLINPKMPDREEPHLPCCNSLVVAVENIVTMQHLQGVKPCILRVITSRLRQALVKHLGCYQARCQVDHTLLAAMLGSAMTLYSAIGALVKAGGGEDSFRTADRSEEAGQCMARPCASTKKCGAARFLVRTGSWASLQLSREQGLGDSQAAVEILFSAVGAREAFTF